MRVTNVAKFLERVDRAAAKHCRRLRRGCVEYFDEAHQHGALENPGFHKRRSYERQREYRILIELRQTTCDPYTLDVGSINDIVHVMPAEEINQSLRLRLPDGSETS